MEWSDQSALERQIAVFRTRWGDFTNPAFVAEELAYKREAAAALRERLSADHLRAWIAAGTLEEAKIQIKRACGGHYAGQSNNLMNQFDIMALDDASAENLVPALYDLLYGDGLFPVRFAAWLAVVQQRSRNCWPSATYFLMYHKPDQYIYVKPEPFKKVLRQLNSPILWESRPSAAKYTELRQLGKALLAQLQPLGAKDLLDVQSFIWTMFPTKP